MKCLGPLALDLKGLSVSQLKTRNKEGKREKEKGRKDGGREGGKG